MRRVLNILLVVAVAVAGVSLWLGRGHSLPGLGDRPVAPRSKALPGGGIAAGSIQLVVLNGTRVTGLARDFGLFLGRAHLAPVGYGNAEPQDYRHSFLVNRRLDPARAEAVAELLGGIPVLREFDSRGTEDVALVLGADHERLRSLLVAITP